MNLTEQLLRDGNLLKRKPRPPKPKKPLPKRSKKREIEDMIYAEKRKAFLRAHPTCQAHGTICEWLHNNDKEAWEAAPWNTVTKPCKATQIHHMKKPRCKYLNDESTWLAVSDWSHRWIEDHKSYARALGLLQ